MSFTSLEKTPNQKWMRKVEHSLKSKKWKTVTIIFRKTQRRKDSLKIERIFSMKVNRYKDSRNNERHIQRLTRMHLGIPQTQWRCRSTDGDKTV